MEENKFQSLLEELEDEDSDVVSKAIFELGNISDNQQRSIMLKYIADIDVEPLFNIAEDDETPTHILEKIFEFIVLNELYEDNETQNELKECIVENLNTSSSVLEQLALDDNLNIRWKVEDHTNTSDEVKSRLKEERSPIKLKLKNGKDLEVPKSWGLLESIRVNLKITTMVQEMISQLEEQKDNTPVIKEILESFLRVTRKMESEPGSKDIGDTNVRENIFVFLEGLTGEFNISSNDFKEIWDKVW